MASHDTKPRIQIRQDLFDPPLLQGQEVIFPWYSALIDSQPTSFSKSTTPAQCEDDVLEVSLSLTRSKILKKKKKKTAKYSSHSSSAVGRSNASETLHHEISKSPCLAEDSTLTTDSSVHSRPRHGPKHTSQLNSQVSFLQYITSSTADWRRDVRARSRQISCSSGYSTESMSQDISPFHSPPAHSSSATVSHTQDNDLVKKPSDIEHLNPGSNGRDWRYVKKRKIARDSVSSNYSMASSSLDKSNSPVDSSPLHEMAPTKHENEACESNSTFVFKRDPSEENWRQDVRERALRRLSSSSTESLNFRSPQRPISPEYSSSPAAKELYNCTSMESSLYLTRQEQKVQFPSWLNNRGGNYVRPLYSRTHKTAI